MGEKYRSRVSRRDSGASALLVILLLLLLINTLGLGYLAYQTYQASTEKSYFNEQIVRLEKEIDKIGSVASTAKTTNSSTSSSVAAETNTSDSQETALGETVHSSTPPETGIPASDVDVAEGQETDQVQDVIEVAEAEATTYIVQPGDALSLIAEQHGLSLEEIMLKNNMVDTTVIIGDVLTVK
ncbi:LysM peptidoglycan-binding domain-containing protein [Enterococcus sp. BWB1-3]|uniref:LysM peptidoglycan-binding domain-containing protein n=1 Tax=unclassified Enterococcus TaxID=2608891 RepID=UPI001922BA81|nr:MULTISPECIES: LysM peptidoglycan-binding domain-containing protein [unclassified Enterococcus]MBL1230796.1 LysM peptidoglycan-binding domain-containing protein [Enterococcus sp. BWB1-3]MCB5950660.1 LysM peptidoglycan-binding domain-containing protein [Enterococcus sp. BWT-B8]